MLRKARIPDIKHIHRIINQFAAKDIMLPRSLNELYENLRDFWVIEENKRVIACCALHISWDNLAEIKSLAVEEHNQNKGLGRQLVSSCIDEAKTLGAQRIFVLTYRPEYFKKLGFRKIRHSSLPHKIWAECINCCKFPDCKEIALIKKL